MIDERTNSLEIKENCNESQTSKKLNRKRFRKSEDNIYNIMNVSTAKKKKKFAKSLSYPKKHRRKALNHTDKEINAKENENPIEIYQTDSSDEDEEEEQDEYSYEDYCYDFCKAERDEEAWF